MATIVIADGVRGGFPSPLLVLGKNGDMSDYETQATLARAVQVLACRRRLAIPGVCSRLMRSSKMTVMLLPFVAQRENYARTLRLQGFYKTDLDEGQIDVEARVTSPSLTISPTLHLPCTGNTVNEFAMDFELGDGGGTAYGQIEGYIEFTLFDWVPRDTTLNFTLLGYTLEAEEAMRIDV